MANLSSNYPNPGSRPSICLSWYQSITLFPSFRLMLFWPKSRYQVQTIFTIFASLKYSCLIHICLDTWCSLAQYWPWMRHLSRLAINGGNLPCWCQLNHCRVLQVPQECHSVAPWHTYSSISSHFNQIRCIFLIVSSRQWRFKTVVTWVFSADTLETPVF